MTVSQRFTLLFSSSSRIVDVLKLRLIEHSLLLWSSEGWDSSTGADRAAPRQVRLQARQIYCFAKATQIGWFPQGAEIARKSSNICSARPRARMAGHACAGDRRQRAEPAVYHLWPPLLLGTP
jgi:mannose/cellobiose epimerase-like protein (N-acyl-D-glucosamine 2-epimerase family)